MIDAALVCFVFAALYALPFSVCVCVSVCVVAPLNFTFALV